MAEKRLAKTRDAYDQTRDTRDFAWLQTTMREFVGWLSVDIPELHHVEVPRLADSLDRFLRLRDTGRTLDEFLEDPFEDGR